MSSKALNKTDFFSDIKKFFPLLKNLVSKDFKIKYRRSILGIAWSVLNPLFTMLVITSVFGKLLKIQIDNFATYYIVGFAIWNFYSEATLSSVNSILSSASLIKKVYIPKYLFPIEKCMFSLVNFFFTLIAVLVVMLCQGVIPGVNALFFVIPVFYCFIYVCGISLFLSAATVFFRDIQHLYSVLLTVIMYLTPIIYPLEIIENEKTILSIVQLNPMTHYVEYFRSLVMYNRFPIWQENIWCFGAAIISLWLGASVFKKAQSKFILHI